MRTKILAIGDIHYGPGYSVPSERRSAIADILLQKVVFRSNRIIKPDVVLILGDLLQNPDIPDLPQYLDRLRDIISRFDCPVITIPGNHDPWPGEFHQIFGEPPEFLDVNDVRIMPFIDPDVPEFDAVRLPHDIDRPRRARHGFDGKLVSVQHVPLFPPGTSSCGTNHTNADEIIAGFRTNGVVLSIGAHAHEGFDLYNHQGVGYVVTPGLCEPPFSFLEITIDGDDITSKRHDLKLPESLRLVDSHVHTELAYCADDIIAPKALTLAGELGLERIIFTEHTGQLYENRQDWLDGLSYRNGIPPRSHPDCRIDEYFRMLRELCQPEQIGFEISCDLDGRPMLDADAMREAGFLLGAVHRMASIDSPAKDLDEACDEFLRLLTRFLPCGIHSLAHPFRIFHRSGLETPEKLFGPTVKLLRENNVAAEINFHGNQPPEQFFRMCLDAEVKLTLGSDSHNNWQVGELSQHLAFLKRIGFTGDLKDILLI